MAKRYWLDYLPKALYKWFWINYLNPVDRKLLSHALENSVLLTKTQRIILCLKIAKNNQQCDNMRYAKLYKKLKDSKFTEKWEINFIERVLLLSRNRVVACSWFLGQLNELLFYKYFDDSIFLYNTVEFKQYFWDSCRPFPLWRFLKRLSSTLIHDRYWIHAFRYLKSRKDIKPDKVRYTIHSFAPYQIPMHIAEKEYFDL